MKTRDDILKPSPRRYKSVPWIGGDVRIQSLTAGEMRQLRETFVNSKGDAIRERVSRQRYVLLCWCFVDDDGNRLLADEDYKSPTWEQIDGALIESAYNAAREWTGFLSDVDWRAVEDAAKNSASAPASS